MSGASGYNPDNDIASIQSTVFGDTEAPPAPTPIRQPLVRPLSVPPHAAEHGFPMRLAEIEAREPRAKRVPRAEPEAEARPTVMRRWEIQVRDHRKISMGEPLTIFYGDVGSRDPGLEAEIKKHVACAFGRGSYLVDIKADILVGGTPAERLGAPPPREAYIQMIISVGAANRIRRAESRDGGIMEMYDAEWGGRMDDIQEPERAKPEIQPMMIAAPQPALTAADVAKIAADAVAAALAASKPKTEEISAAERLRLDQEERKIALEERKLDEAREERRAKAEREERIEQQRREDARNQQMIELATGKNRKGGGDTDSMTAVFQPMLAELVKNSLQPKDPIKQVRDLAELNNSLKKLGAGGAITPATKADSEDDEEKMPPWMKMLQGMVSDFAPAVKTLMENRGKAQAQGNHAEVARLNAELQQKAAEIEAMRAGAARNALPYQNPHMVQPTHGRQQVQPAAQPGPHQQHPAQPMPKQVQTVEILPARLIGKSQRVPRASEAPVQEPALQPLQAQMATPNPPEPQIAEIGAIPSQMEGVSATHANPTGEPPVTTAIVNGIPLPDAPSDNLTGTSPEDLARHLGKRVENFVDWYVTLDERRENTELMLAVYEAALAAELAFIGQRFPAASGAILADLDTATFATTIRKAAFGMSPKWYGLFATQQGIAFVVSELHNAMRCALKMTDPNKYAHYQPVPFGKADTSWKK